MLPTKCLRCSLANCYYPITISKLINLLAFHSQITCYMLDKVTDNISLVLSAKSGQSDIRDGTYYSTKRKVLNPDKCSQTSPTWPWSPRRGPSTSPLSSLGQVTLVDQFLALHNILNRRYSSRRTYRRSRLIV